MKYVAILLGLIISAGNLTGRFDINWWWLLTVPLGFLLDVIVGVWAAWKLTKYENRHGKNGNKVL